MQSFNNLKKEILSVLKNSPLAFEVKHAQLVHKWVLELKPDADEPLQIAALAHDIDRAVTGITEKDLKDFSKLNGFKKEHAQRSAKLISDILKKHDYPDTIVDKVKFLVANHEEGGDNESDVLRDADSLAFFEYNIPSYMERNSLDRTKEKMKFMFNRMSSKAKKKIKNIDYKNIEIRKLVDRL
ncbi:DUF4202 domain-containing protein [candidate division WWE3 bacterium]|uniref:DUF4202 domain-containing protein n=1 Tax=candidate division WWE3 bacterium TaxID=2053526 RepID=A0A7X9E6A0_UNCKA|nr:DUF4202 domain-containing protein [candidate division WWE3 bacterium]